MKIKATTHRLNRWLLWSKIEKFNIDEYAPAGSFVAKLAAKNGWTIPFAEKVLAEYRRFIFLAAIADSEVTPSKAVDEAWHLHLTCTRSYWDGLCGKVLKKPLHHNPGSGVAGDELRYAAQYHATLMFYDDIFEDIAPADVWGETTKASTEQPANKPDHRVRNQDTSITPLAATCGGTASADSSPGHGHGHGSGHGDGGSHGGSHGGDGGGAGSHCGGGGGGGHCGGGASCGGASCGGGGCGGGGS